MPAPPPIESRLARLGRLAARRRRTVAVAWLVLVAVAVFGGHRVAGDWSVDYSTPGSESAAVDGLIGAEFPALTADSLLLTWKAAAGAESPAARALVERQLRTLDALPSVDTTSFDRARISADGRTGLIEVPLTERAATLALDHGPAFVEAAERASAPGIDVRYGGRMMEMAQPSSTSQEGVGLMFALVILLLTFGTIVAAGLPIATALAGIGTGAAVVGLLASVANVPDWAESVVMMVGIGVGIDYALLILTRHRAGLAAGLSVEDAIAASLATAGRSVLVAGGTVVISLLGLLLMGLPYLVGVAFAASSSVLLVMIASITLLPALLAFAGMRVNALAIPRPGRRRRAEQGPLAGSSGAGGAASRPGLAADGPTDASPGFARWSAAVQRRPWAAVVAGLAVIAVLTAPVAGMRMGFPGAGNLSADRQARQSHELVTAAFGAGVASPLQVVAERRAGSDAAIERLREAISRDSRVVAVGEPVVSDDGRYALLAVQAKEAADTPQTDALLTTLRERTITGSGVAAQVGGWTATTHDQAAATASRLPILFLAVAGLSALLLLAAFRSVLIPIKAALMNVLSIAAAYGVVAALAEGGALGGLIGIDDEVPIPPWIPILMFAVLFGLSMDYEVFLVGRIRELWLEHGDASRAVTEGIAATARVITAAAAIMIAVFGSFGLSDDVTLQLIGVGMATAILVDATVIRLLLVPALMGLMGERAWWMPAWLERIVPAAELEGSAPVAARAAAATAGEAPAAERLGGAAERPLVAAGDS